MQEDLIARTPDEFFRKQEITVFLQNKVTSIQPEKKRIRVKDLASGEEALVEYDHLVISTGAHAIIPPVEGIEAPGVFTLRSLTDAITISDYLKSFRPASATIMGAGAIGLEMCEAFIALELQVNLVELTDQVMPPISPQLSPLIAEHLVAHGMRIFTGTRVQAIGQSQGRASHVITDREEIPSELVLISTGIRPASELAAEAGLELGVRGAIRVDERMRTSAENIFAAGDCVTSRHLLTGAEVWIPLGSTSRKQGRIAGNNAAGGNASFSGIIGTFIVKCLELTIGKTGLSEAEARAAGFNPLTLSVEESSLPGYYDEGGRMHFLVTADADSGRVLGAEVVGDLASQADKRLDIFSLSILGRLTANDLKELDLAYAPPYSHPVDLPIIAGNLLSSSLKREECHCDGEGLERDGRSKNRMVESRQKYNARGAPWLSTKRVPGDKAIVTGLTAGAGFQRLCPFLLGVLRELDEDAMGVPGMDEGFFP